ncbi:hypothetical protein ACIQXW_08325 [Lysinibacillus sp. NPDC097162]|uniref:hypothetical protein n=1 Tax=Lysinibacillus sp. NPDC097162 TaxID=3364140 RepID=UPI003805A432
MLEVVYNDAVVCEMTNRNVLGIGLIKIYVVNSFEQYAFYFASDPLEVNMLHQALFGEVAGGITEAHRLLTKVMYFADFDIQTSLLEYRKTIVQFPAYLGHAAAGQYHLYRFDLHKGGRRIV